MRKKKHSKNQRLIISTEERLRRDLFFVNNPVLVEGLALAPVVGAAVTLQNSLTLAVMVLFLLIPTRFLGNLFVGFVPQRLRAMLYALIACGCYIPGYMLIYSLFGIRAASLGIYLPMLVVDAIIISRTEIPQRESIADSLVNGILTSLGFAFAVLLTGAVRELAGQGKVWGNDVLAHAPLPIAATAAGGFIAVAVLAAVLQHFVSSAKRAIYRRAKENE